MENKQFKMDDKIIYYINEMDKLVTGRYVNPITVEIDPTNKCNAKCGFCMFTKYREEHLDTLPMDIYGDLVRELINLETKSITFTGGGEPTLHPDFNEMCEIALDLDFEIGLVTNGILLDKVKYIKDFTFVRVSLDAKDAETYKKVKGVDQFVKVIDNIKCASHEMVGHGTIGISYVVNEDNKDGIEGAQYLSDDLGADYIQFKPAYINGKVYKDFSMPDIDDITINTERFIADDNLPCDVAHLVGIIGADSNVYYCCQHRGKPEFSLGSLQDSSFEHLWRERMKLRPDVTKCPSCRYLNYSNAYKNMKGDVFFQHRRFL